MEFAGLEKFYTSSKKSFHLLNLIQCALQTSTSSRRQCQLVGLSEELISTSRQEPISIISVVIWLCVFFFKAGFLSSSPLGFGSPVANFLEMLSFGKQATDGLLCQCLHIFTVRVKLSICDLLKVQHFSIRTAACCCRIDHK